MRKEPPGPIAKAASGAKIVGALFICTGGLPMFIALEDRRDWVARIAGIATTIVLVGPGVWYLMAGIFLQRKQYWAVKTTYKVALGQVVAVVLAILVSTFPTQGRNRSAAMMIILPAIMTCYFLPALIALLFDLRRAGRELIVMETRGFAVEALPVQRIENLSNQEESTTDEHR